MQLSSSKLAFCPSNLLFCCCSSTLNPAISVCSSCCSWRCLNLKTICLALHSSQSQPSACPVLQNHIKALFQLLLLSCSSCDWTRCYPTPDTSCSMDQVLQANGSSASCTMQPWQVDSTSSLGLTLIMVQLHGASSTEW